MATVGDCLWERLIAWGVKRVYGYPGDSIGGIIGALARTNGAIEFDPYAIAAKFAFRDRPVIALAGDGAMPTNGSAELLTIANYWPDGATATGRARAQ